MTYADAREIYNKAIKAGIAENVTDFARKVGISASGIQRMLEREEGHLTRYSRIMMEEFIKYEMGEQGAENTTTSPESNTTSKENATTSDYEDFRRQVAKEMLIWYCNAHKEAVINGIYHYDYMPNPVLAGEAAAKYANQLVKYLKETEDN
jgi:hypothetical protein